MVKPNTSGTSQASALREKASEDALLAAYSELCTSYHAIDDFRMKLLGLLPFASLVGLILLDRGQMMSGMATGVGREVIGFSALFASALTLSLFSYEIRGIRRCHNLFTEGTHLEELLGIGHGQFHICSEEHTETSKLIQASNSKFAACTIYSLVFAGWLFIALRFGFGIETRTCSLWAVVAAAVIASLTYLGVRKWTAA